MKNLRGIPAASGLAIGPAHIIHPAPSVDISAQRTVDTQGEISRLEPAIAHAIVRLDTLRSKASASTGAILAAQREMLDDPELKEGADALIETGVSGGGGITRNGNGYGEQIAGLPDPYLAARAEDVHEAGRRIVAELQGTSLEVSLDRAGILVARDLAPAETVGLDPALLQAIVTEKGSATGHLAIVAQGLGIPAVVGIPDIFSQIDEGTVLVVDGDSRTVTVAPDEATHIVPDARLAPAQQDKKDLDIYRDRPDATAAAVTVALFANIRTLAKP